MGEMLDLNAETFDERITIMRFIDWLNMQNMEIAVYTEEELRKDYPRLVSISENLERMLDRFFEIDSKQLEEEKKKLLDGMRE